MSEQVLWFQVAAKSQWGSGARNFDLPFYGRFNTLTAGKQCATRELKKRRIEAAKVTVYHIPDRIDVGYCMTGLQPLQPEWIVANYDFKAAYG